jgi:Uma2 family endonuclease
MTVLDDPKTRLMTTADLLAIPDDGIERWLINGQLREGTTVSRRGFRHSGATAEFGYILRKWLDQRSNVGGRILVGDAAFQLTDNPDSTVGIDIAYIDESLAQSIPESTYIIRGVPVLAVEILSPSDTEDQVQEKIAAYLKAGVKLVWIVEPIHCTITVYRPDAEPELFSLSEEISADPHLPGFVAKVRSLFGK